MSCFSGPRHVVRILHVALQALHEATVPIPLNIGALRQPHTLASPICSPTESRVPSSSRCASSVGTPLLAIDVMLLLPDCDTSSCRLELYPTAGPNTAAARGGHSLGRSSCILRLAMAACSTDRSLCSSGRRTASPCPPRSPGRRSQTPQRIGEVDASSRAISRYHVEVLLFM